MGEKSLSDAWSLVIICKTGVKFFQGDDLYHRLVHSFIVLGLY